jgi:transposase InsO family protein
VRQSAVEFFQWTRNQGYALPAVAGILNLATRTLRQWIYDDRKGCLRSRDLGRPVRWSSRDLRNELWEVLQELGPWTGVPTLRQHFPEMERAELINFVSRYRNVWRWRNREYLCLLEWTKPGTVWAMDFTEASPWIDGQYRYVLAVRDLASGQQLLARPLLAPTAEQVRSALDMLFAQHGAPLVLKTDNGSAFRAGEAKDFLRRARVIPLFSPARLPRYNGAIEAGIGSLKARSEIQATRAGRPGVWTWDDVEAGRLEANATARPRGETGPTPEEIWTNRDRLTGEQRKRFAAAVAAHQRDLDPALTKLDDWVGGDEAWPNLWNEKEREQEDRAAVRRALETCGYLLYPRRRIALPIRKRKVT